MWPKNTKTIDEIRKFRCERIKKLATLSEQQRRELRAKERKIRDVKCKTKEVNELMEKSLDKCYETDD